MKRCLPGIVVAVTLALLAGGLMGLRHSLGWIGTRGGMLALRRRGTLASTTFRHPPSDTWQFGGSAPVRDRFYTWRPGRLAVGVNDSGQDAFHGYFAVTRSMFPANSYVQATVDPLVAHTDPHQTAETVVALQTGWTKVTGAINYLVASELSYNGHRPLLLAGYAHGRITDARTLSLASHLAQHVLPPGRPYTVTIRSDGRHTAQFWIGRNLLYAGRHLHLAIAPPFQVYLEVQARDMRYTAAFAGLAVYSGDAVRIGGLPTGAQVVFADDGQHLRASSDSAGQATLRLPLPALHLTGNLDLTAGDRRWSFQRITLAGGDALRFGRLPSFAWWLQSVPPAPWLRPLT